MTKTLFKEHISRIDNNFHDLFLSFRVNFFNLLDNKFYLSEIHNLLDSCEDMYEYINFHNRTLQSFLEEEKDLFRHSKVAAVFKKTCEGVHKISNMIDAHYEIESPLKSFSYIKSICDAIEGVEVDECFSDHLDNVLNVDMKSFTSREVIVYENDYSVCS